MTDEGIKKCFGALQGAYRSFYKDNTQNDWTIMKEVWQIQFGNADDREVFYALNRCLSKCKYPPSIAEIKMELMPEDDFNEEEAWAMILKAGKNGNYEAEQEWEKLPNEIKSVTTPGTIREIALAEDGDVPFIKRDVMNSLRARHTRNINNRLASRFTDRDYLETEELLMIETDDDDDDENNPPVGLFY